MLSLLCHAKISEYDQEIQSILDTSNFKGVGKICRVISSSR